MTWISARLARLLGTTLEDWLLALLVIAAVALTVLGVRGCEDDHVRESRAAVAATR